MKPDPKRIIEEAMQLPANSRASIAEALLESLDFEEDFPISQEWLEEIRKRCGDIDRGDAELLDSKAVLKKLREKYI